MNTYTARINHKKFTIRADSTSEAVMKLENLTGVPAKSFSHTVRMI